MRNQFFKLLTFLALAAFSLNVNAQSCSGSLGDPVVNVDFGTGFGVPLGAAFTTYNYLSGCPNDGEYTITNFINNCHNNSWVNIGDHTGNNGNMMLVNASFTKGVFYTQRAVSAELCPGTTYELAAWVLNVMRTNMCGNGGIRPNLTFTIETENGVILLEPGQTEPYTTKDIEPDGKWHRYSTFFTTPTSTTNVIVKISNNADGGCGNDLALDDITFSACGPEMETSFVSNQSQTEQLCPGDNKIFSINGKASDPTFRNYQWQQKVGDDWVDINPAVNNTANSENLLINIQNAQVGGYSYRLGAAKNGNLASLSCRVYSKPLTINVDALPVANGLAATYTVCEGSPLSLPALTGGATYRISGPGKSVTEQAGPVTIANIGLLNAGEYTVRAVSAIGCVGPAVKFNVLVKKNFTAAIDITAFTLCKGETVKLTARQVGGDVNDTFTYTWSLPAGLDNTNQAVVNASPAQTTTYTVTISNGVCTSSKDVTITVNTPPEIKNHIGTSNATTQPVCEGDNIVVELNAAAPVGFRNYQWQILNGANWDNISGATNQQLNVPAANLVVATYQYRVTSWEDGNVGSAYCRLYAAEPVKIIVNPIPTLSPIADVILCAGETLSLTANGAPIYEWTGADLPAPRAGNPLIVTGLTAGEHFFTVRGFASSTNCPSKNTITVKVTVKPPIEPMVATPAALCEGSSTTLTVNTNSTAGNTYSWSPSTGLNFTDRATVEASPTQTTTYKVTVTNGLCVEETEVTVPVITKPVITATKQRYLFEGDALTLDAAVTGIYTSISWEPRAGLSDPQSLTPTASPVNDTEYRLTVTNADCSFDATETIFVQVFKKITIPNTFTPNGDGINDVWNIKELLAFPKSVTTIFNRYGQQLYQSIGYGKPWDGRYNGNNLPPGTYYYIIDLKNNTPKRTGYVTILK